MAQDGVTELTYTIMVTRLASDNVQLSSLEINEGVLSPAFEPSIYSYFAEVSHDITAVSITPVVDDKNAKLLINGQLQASGSPIQISLGAGNTNVQIKVVAEDGIHSSNYMLSIQREASSNAALEDLILSDGKLSPAFTADQHTYNATVPYSVSQIRVSALTHEPNATLRINGNIVLSGEPTDPIKLKVGSNVITIEVTAQDGVTMQEYQINITRSKIPTNNSGGGENKEDDEKLDDLTEVYVDNMNVNRVVNSKITTENGKSRVLNKVDTTALKSSLEQVGDSPVIRVQTNQNVEEVTVTLMGDAVKVLESKNALLHIETANGSYKLPASEISIEQVSEQFGNSAVEEIEINMTIAKGDTDKLEKLGKVAQQKGFVVQAAPVEFTITAFYDGKQLKVNKFSRFIQREIPIKKNTNSKSMTTAVVIEEDGQLRHVPAYKAVNGDVEVAVIQSITNSTYTVIENFVQFADVKGHWSEIPVNDLASRLIVSGMGPDRFRPTVSTTRAEFTAIIVWALGLATDTQRTVFKDINPNKWYAGVVTAANDYGIIHGYGDGSF
ncbi:cadherin-like beta sandwich domain-containing protein [Robertmurraya sp. DFI.2.37]|uniref:cadherin-like beta sandwich domain-containing protein n=1 Tax=Robertmurraya sp. DFI.2.37 TaxID=3031819 RepID=UPI0023DB79B0|nr:cadherin-like beta sandwich domain-containing protein [Robertmurraya sp. DFI.2.37]MDF1510284.1 cadherin-like beta sandwich domain-containing protein [Robertmurraya sp. DFI.2.37]